MDLEIGDKRKPTGNLIVYCRVIGENPIDSGAKIIASNVFVSLVTSNDTLPVVTFPPVAVKDSATLKRKIFKLQNFDVCRVSDFVFPEDSSLGQEYVQSRLQDFHEVVNQYVELCSRVLIAADEAWKKESAAAEKSAAVAVAPKAQTAAAENVWERIHALEEAAAGLRQAAVADPESVDESNVREFNRQWRDLTHKYPQYDFQNLIKYIKTPANKAGELIDLYFKKFRAIYFENYEEAGAIKRDIERIEAEMPTA